MTLFPVPSWCNATFILEDMGLLSLFCFIDLSEYSGISTKLFSDYFRAFFFFWTTVCVHTCGGGVKEEGEREF